MCSDRGAGERGGEAYAIEVSDLGKSYHIYGAPQDRLKQALLRWRRTYYREFWALRHATFSVRKGESVGIVGVNGSGKSTLLQIIAGTLTPTEGRATVRGRVGALLELGSGFNPEFTGRENVYLSGSILGISAREMDARFDDIASFADIGEFLDQPVKTYSSGMMVRLAFSVQVQVEPDILIVDEALAVGDNLFQKRCYQRLMEMRDAGVTLLFVSHSQETVRTLTSRAVLLHHGAVRAIGEPGEVLLDYRRLLHEEERRWNDAQLAVRESAAARGRAEPAGADGERQRAIDALSFGDLDAQIERVEVVDAKGDPCSVFRPGETLRIRVGFSVSRPMTKLNIGVRIRSKEGVKVYSWGTLNQDIAVWAGRCAGTPIWERTFEPGRAHEAEFECDTPLGANFYEVQASVSEEHDRYYGEQRILHWRDEAAFFQVVLSAQEHFFGGVCDLRMKAVVRT